MSVATTQRRRADITFTFDRGSRPPGVRTAYSLVMARASSIWRMSLYPPWSSVQFVDPGNTNIPSPAPAVRNLDFTDDYYPALRLIILFVHGLGMPTEEKLTRRRRYELAVLCDKYDCMESMYPFVDRWCLGGWIEESATSKVYTSSLTVAWVFGNQKLFDHTATAIARGLEPQSGRRGEGGNGRAGYCHQIVDDLRDDLVIVPDILESILEVRTAAIRALLDIPYSLADRLLSPTSTVCPNISHECDKTLYTCFIKGLTAIGIWPKVQPEEYKGGFLSLAEKLRCFKMSIFDDQSGFSCQFTPSNGPRGCLYASRQRPTGDYIVGATEFSGAVAMVDIECPTLPSHKRHMEIQRVKLGNTVESVMYNRGPPMHRTLFD